MEVGELRGVNAWDAPWPRRFLLCRSCSRMGGEGARYGDMLSYSEINNGDRWECFQTVTDGAPHRLLLIDHVRRRRRGGCCRCCGKWFSC
jgi:hypothetical protein